MTARYADDFRALRRAIKGIVTGETLGGRPIRPDRFRWGSHRVETQDMAPSSGDPPTVQVVYGSPRPHEATPLSHTGNYRSEIVEVTLEVLYHFAGGDYLGDEGGDYEAVQGRALDDGAALISALGYAGNLVTAPDGHDTGLMSGRLERGETIDPTIDAEGGRYIARHRFQAWVQLAQHEVSP